MHATGLATRGLGKGCGVVLSTTALGLSAAPRCGRPAGNGRRGGADVTGTQHAARSPASAVCFATVRAAFPQRARKQRVLRARARVTRRALGALEVGACRLCRGPVERGRRAVQGWEGRRGRDWWVVQGRPRAQCQRRQCRRAASKGRPGGQRGERRRGAARDRRGRVSGTPAGGGREVRAVQQQQSEQAAGGAPEAPAVCGPVAFQDVRPRARGPRAFACAGARWACMRAVSAGMHVRRRPPGARCGARLSTAERAGHEIRALGAAGRGCGGGGAGRTQTERRAGLRPAPALASPARPNEAINGRFAPSLDPPRWRPHD